MAAVTPTTPALRTRATAIGTAIVPTDLSVDLTIATEEQGPRSIALMTAALERKISTEHDDGHDSRDSTQLSMEK